jgi:hypothetical protein
MAASISKGGLEGEQNPWAPPVPDLLTDEPSPQESPGEPSEQPPQYSDARITTSGNSTSIAANSRSPLLMPKIPFDLYRIPEASTSADQIIITSKHPPFYNDSDTLFALLKDQITLPPKPVLRIVGKHKLYTTGTITDFDLKLNLTSLLWRPEAQQWNYLKFPPISQQQPSQPTSRDPRRSSQIPSRSHDPPQDLPTLCHAFTSDPSPSKSLTLARTTSNLDTNYLHGQVLALLAQSKYMGTVSITFPSTYSSVVIQKGTPLGQTWRSVLSTAASWVTLGKAPVKPTSYNIEVVWPFATSPSHSPAAQVAEERKCAVQSEVEWWATWSSAVRNAVLSGRRGWVGSEDWIEAKMGWREEERREDWGASDGGNGVR